MVEPHVFTFEGVTLKLRKLTVTEAGAAMLAADVPDRRLATSQAMIEAIRYGVSEIEGKGERPKYGWTDADLEALREDLGIGGFMALGQKLVSDNLNPPGLRGKSGAPSAS